MNEPTDVKHVFVCGLHRSGTTMLARHIANMKNCTSFKNTGAVMDEGQFLQDIYPPDTVYGGVGRFGFASQAHLTEMSPLLTPANVSRLQRSWAAYWDSNKSIRVEKTPANLLMTRFLQQVFENAYFIVIKRHPVPVSLATQKWSRTPLHKLLEHWLHCYSIIAQDKQYLRHVYEIKYEEYVNDPSRYLAEIAAFIDAEMSVESTEDIDDACNGRYFSRWGRMLESSPYKKYYRVVAQTYEKDVMAHGYSLMEPCRVRVAQVVTDKVIDRAARTLLYVGAGIYVMPWRLQGLLKYKIKQAFAED